MFSAGSAAAAFREVAELLCCVSRPALVELAAEFGFSASDVGVRWAVCEVCPLDVFEACVFVGRLAEAASDVCECSQHVVAVGAEAFALRPVRE